MSVDCGSTIAKYLLCIFNFTFFILGTIVLSVGIWVAADKSSFIALLKMVENENVEQFTQPAVIEQMAYVLIACGALMFFLSFLGYCGAIRESQCMLTTYAILMILIIVAQITLGGLAAAYKDKARVETKNYLQSTFTRYYSTSQRTDAVSLMWNHLMIEMKCCGVNDYNDFSQSDSWNLNRGNKTIPEACCHQLTRDGESRPRDDTCTTSPSETNSFYKTGCYEALVNWMLSNRNLIIMVTIGIGIIELLLIFFTCCLCKSIDKYRVMRL